ncbi:MAG: alpha/beta hydrolase [Actinomycetota bacterium]|nr:alpha/beta hydrolase [Actinomycetota bacterium]MDA8073422.1 alpha/beta hydrolase [Actinomycetota bacterium]
MAPSFLILHGIENYRPPQHWQFLLAADLTRAGHAVSYPQLPTPDAPKLDDWLQALCSEVAGMADGPHIVICHSLACLLWLHAAHRHAIPTVDRVLLVAPPASANVPDAGASFRLEAIDVAAVRSSAAGEIAIVCSDADPYNPMGAQGLYGDPLGITATVLPGAGHITPDSGYGHWPFAIQWCLPADRGR